MLLFAVCIYELLLNESKGMRLVLHRVQAPRVESGLSAALRAWSQVGLEVLRRKGTVLQCYSNMAETVTFSEIGMSLAVLEAGFNIDSLMLRYQVTPRIESNTCHSRIGAVP